MGLDIHNYAERLNRELVYLEKSKLSAANKAVIRRFHDDCIVQGLSKPRIVKLSEVMRTLAGMMRTDLQKAKEADIKALVADMEKKSWTAWTKATHKVILKKFYKWLRGNNEEFPPEVKWLKTAVKRQETTMLSSNELITDEEIKRAIDCCDHPRSKAFLAVLAESGCRVGEIGGLILNNVAFDRHGAILTVMGKTGARRVRIVQSAQRLATWLDCHPFKNNPDAALWINIGTVNYRKPAQYGALAKLIRDAFKRAGITKRCNPHLFRHSRASVLANHLTEFQMNHYFGWTQGSNMPSTYVHLSGKDLDEAILRVPDKRDSGQLLAISSQDTAQKIEHPQKTEDVAAIRSLLQSIIAKKSESELLQIASALVKT
jgi:integrase